MNSRHKKTTIYFRHFYRHNNSELVPPPLKQYQSRWGEFPPFSGVPSPNKIKIIIYVAFVVVAFVLVVASVVVVALVEVVAFVVVVVFFK